MTLHANAKRIPVSISIVSYRIVSYRIVSYLFVSYRIVSYVYHFVGVYLVVDLVVYFHVLAMG